MLRELSIKNLAIIDELSLSFVPGLNVLTGETGAGKSIIIDAVGLLLGGRADSVFIRADCEAALVEGSFTLAEALRDELHTLLEREGLEQNSGETYLTLGRELRNSGRNICRVNGRTVNLAVLREIGVRLVDVHGQSEHLSLLRVREHLALLDRFGGLSAQRVELGGEVRELHAVRAELSDLRAGEREAMQRSELLNFQISEINAAGLQPGEEGSLREERARLANAEKLAELTQTALQVAGEGDATDGSSSGGDSLGQLVQVLEQVARIDVGLQTQHALANSLLEQLRDLSGELIAYRDGIEFNSSRLTDVEKRLDLIQDLRRKYGTDIVEVLEYGKRAQVELENITGVEERIQALGSREKVLLEKVSNVGRVLSVKRREAGERLAKRVMESMSELNMDGARFAVGIEWYDDPDGVSVEDGRRVGFDASGIDRVEFLVAPNPGEGLKPIAKIASGGETSRLMLALREVLARADRKPTLIFDEIDQGIGGRVGAIVGRKLWGLTASHQVMCITHLPQLAGYGDAHFKVEKQVYGERTRTRVYELERAERVEELAQMVGVQGEAIRDSATSLLVTAESEKEACA
jgi:DNA repair protein RecN (Recombination protein N)